MSYSALSYHEISALRYAKTENRADAFALLLAPRIVRLFNQNRAPEAGSPWALDVGAGTGQMTDVLRSSGFRTVAIDFSLPMLARRAGERSGSIGPAAVGDATALPISGQFDLITATFNVLNHLDSLDAVAAAIEEVARLLAPGGLFVFDVNTRIGLIATGQTTQHQSGPDGSTTWTRHWLDDSTLRLRAQGEFRHEGQWLEYDETIDKIVIPTLNIERHCLAAGLGPVRWATDDLVTTIDKPESHAVAFGIVRTPSLEGSTEPG